MSNMCKKISYPDFAKALTSMQRINRKPGFDLKRAYECKACGMWHLTSWDMVYGG
jgi:hypothetical protein